MISEYLGYLHSRRDIRDVKHRAEESHNNSSGPSHVSLTSHDLLALGLSVNKSISN